MDDYRMTYNLTAQQARHFIDTGRLLIVSKIEPQPDFIDESGPETLQNGVIECPFTKLGEITKFREPWTRLLDDYENTTYIATQSLSGRWPPYKNIQWNKSSTIPVEAIRLSGKCVRLETKLVKSMSKDEAIETGLWECPEEWNWDTAKKDFATAWAWFATFERIYK